MQEGSAVSEATPRRNKSSLKILSTLRLHEGSSKGFLFFEEFNSPWFIFLSVRNFQPPPSCQSWRTPGPTGEDAAPLPQRTRRFRTPGASACGSTARTPLLARDVVLCLPTHQALGRAFGNTDGHPLVRMPMAGALDNPSQAAAMAPCHQLGENLPSGG